MSEDLKSQKKFTEIGFALNISAGWQRVICQKPGTNCSYFVLLHVNVVVKCTYSLFFCISRKSYKYIVIINCSFFLHLSFWQVSNCIVIFVVMWLLCVTKSIFLRQKVNWWSINLIWVFKYCCIKFHLFHIPPKFILDVVNYNFISETTSQQW